MPATPVSVSAVTDHGGNLSSARLRFPGAPEPWLDLSTGINPRPYPLPPLTPEVWQRLPDDTTLECLYAAAAEAYGAPGPSHLAAASGSQALIQLLPRLRPVGRVTLLGPTYAEHAACWGGAGHRVTLIETPETPETLDQLTDGAADVVVAVNPNNPDGRRIRPDFLAALAHRLAERGGWLVVDEAFADVTPDLSAARHSGRPGLIVLRSFGKFYGLAGLRLGFALAAPELTGRIRTALGPWSVSGPAAVVGAVALADAEWAAATRERLSAEAGRLDRLLERHGLTVRGGTSLFRLAETGVASAFWQKLGNAGILVRRFDAYPRWLRFGLPADEPAWRRLAEALR